MKFFAVNLQQSVLEIRAFAAFPVFHLQRKNHSKVTNGFSIMNVLLHEGKKPDKKTLAFPLPSLRSTNFIVLTWQSYDCHVKIENSVNLKTKSALLVPGLCSLVVCALEKFKEREKFTTSIKRN